MGCIYLFIYSLAFSLTVLVNICRVINNYAIRKDYITGLWKKWSKPPHFQRSGCQSKIYGSNHRQQRSWCERVLQRLTWKKELKLTAEFSLLLYKSVFPHYEIFIFAPKSVEHVSLCFNNASWAVFAVDAIIFCIIK